MPQIIRLKFWIFSKIQTEALKFKQKIPVIMQPGLLDNDFYVAVYAMETERTEKATHLRFVTSNGDFYYWCPLSAMPPEDAERINAGIKAGVNKIRKVKKGEKK